VPLTTVIPHYPNKCPFRCHTVFRYLSPSPTERTLADAQAQPGVTLPGDLAAAWDAVESATVDMAKRARHW
jgi:hypothetical protein